MTAPYDPSAVGFAGILTLVAGGIAWPLWKTFLAKQNAEAKGAAGEASWMIRQADKINEQERIISEFVKLRATDAELIAALRLKDAMAGEKAERLMEHIERLNRRSLRLENLICEIRPDLTKWVRSDFSELGPPELDGPHDTIPVGPDSI